MQYARQVIEEYKKFAFLAVVAGHPATPSDQVDQAWHLHLSYTRSYWEEFCLQVLRMPLHHDPTLGGEAENQKFDDWYNKTLESYERFFGQVPPSHLWSPSKVRFGRDLHFVRLNTQQNWVLPKSIIYRGASLGLTLSLALLLGGCYIGKYEVSLKSPGSLIPPILAVLTCFWLIGVLVAFVQALMSKNPLIGPGSGGGDGSSGGGCGGGGCGGGGCGGGGCGGG